MPKPSFRSLKAKAKRDGWADWIRSEADERAVFNGCYFDEKAGLRVVEFIEKYTHHSKDPFAGKPFILEPWERDDLTMPLFGWKNADGVRRYTIAAVFVPKKQGKSTYCAALTPYMLIADGERGPEVYGVAFDREQAGIIWREANNMIKQSPGLSNRLHGIEGKKRILYPARNGFYQALSRETLSAEGINSSFTVYDELHTQKTRVMWDTLRYAGVTRRQPLLLTVSTAGWDRDSICYEIYEQAKQILKGTIFQDEFFPFIREAEEDDDWTDPKVWRKANPSMGVTITEKRFAAACAEAQTAPSKENSFKRYRLNMWTQQESRYIPMAAWKKCGGTIDIEELRGRDCYGGLDLASTLDLNALVLAFPFDDERPGAKPGDKIYKMLSFFWIPKERADSREQANEVKYLTWERQGLIGVTPGNTTDYGFIEQRLLELRDDPKFNFNIVSIGFDPCQANFFATRMQDNYGFDMQKVPQGYFGMNESTKEFLALVLSGSVKHGDNEILTWCADNMAVKEGPTALIMPVKPDGKAAKKIDGIVSAIMATGLAASTPDQTSMYEEHGLRSLMDDEEEIEDEEDRGDEAEAPHYFGRKKADPADTMLIMAKGQGYVPLNCLLGGTVVMAEVNAGRDPCAGCKGPREKCGGRPEK